MCVIYVALPVDCREGYTGAHNMIPVPTLMRSIGQDGHYCGSFVNKLNVKSEGKSLATSVEDIENNAKSLVQIL